jgi:hypothetical protein
MKDIYMNKYDIKDTLKEWQGHRDKSYSVKFGSQFRRFASISWLLRSLFATVLPLETKYERGREQ